jgi:flagellin-like hook-associated protein FlgL
LEFRNLLDVTYGAYVVCGAYSGINGSNGAPTRDQAVATIVELIRGNVEAVRQDAQVVSTTVSAVQKFKGALATIAEKLTAMQELTDKASSPDYNEVQVEQMQRDLEKLAEEINQVVDDTEHNNKRLFGSQGQSILLAASDGSQTRLFAKDFSVDATGWDLASEPDEAKSAIGEAIDQLTEYGSHLDRQMAGLKAATARLERDLAGAMGVEPADFTPELAPRVFGDVATAVASRSSGLVAIQASADPRRVFVLLTDQL